MMSRKNGLASLDECKRVVKERNLHTQPQNFMCTSEKGKIRKTK